jgi:YlmC/YmxH family sporulation protein
MVSGVRGVGLLLVKTSELWVLDVINTVDGQRLGNITDLDIDLATGKINALILTEVGGFLGMFRRGDIIIPWDKVLLIGIDVILVEMNALREPKRSR